MKDFGIVKKRSLTLRLMAVMAIALITFTLMAGILYNVMAREASVEHYNREMQRNAYEISQNLHDLLAPGGYGTLDDTRLTVSWDTLAPFLALTEQITGCNVYLIDAGHRITGYFDGIVQTLNHVLLAPYLEQSIALGFMRKTPFVTSGSGDMLRLSTSAPIMDQNGRVLGVVLLDASLKELGFTQVSETTLLVISAVAALAVALILAFILSSAVAKPILKTGQAALELAFGDYRVRLPVKGRDEVSQLGASINILADELEKARERDHQIKERQQQFFSMISHELRTPVTVIRGSVESLADNIIQKPEDRDAAYRQIIKETAALQKLIQDMLELSRLQDTEFEIEMSSVDLSELLSDVAMSAGTLCMRKGIEFRCDEPKRSFITEGDPRRLRQMLMAVIDNAVKFTEPGGSITLSLAEEAPVIRIADDGRGMSEDEMSHIFDRFYRSKEKNGEGTGLGLALVREIAIRHHIRIRVDSREGGGTVFLFHFEEKKEG